MLYEHWKRAADARFHNLADFFTPAVNNGRSVVCNLAVIGADTRQIRAKK